MTSQPLVTTSLDERERPGARHGSRAKNFVVRLATRLRDHAIDDVGAMMAFYTIFALFPMLLFVVSLALVVVPASTLDEGVWMATRTLPEALRTIVEDRVASLADVADAGFAVGGAAIALYGASRGTIALMVALVHISGVPETRSWIRRQLIAFAVTAGVALLLVVALVLLVVGPIAGRWFAMHLGLDDSFETLWAIARWTGAGALVMLVWAILYKFLPNSHAPFRVFTIGAFVGLVLWLAVSFLFGVYLARFASYEATYGTLGGAIIFLTWLWLTNIVILLAAEIDAVIAEQRSRVGESRSASISDETSATAHT